MSDKLLNEKDFRPYVEMGLIFALIVVLPFEDAIPTIMGKTVPALLLGFSLLYLLLFRANRFFQCSLSRIVLSFILFVVLCLAFESVRPIRHFSFGVRVFQMAIGIAVFAALVTLHKRNLRVVLWALVTAGGLVAFLLVPIFFQLATMNVTDFKQSTWVRAMLFDDLGLGQNLNVMSVFLTLCCSAGIGLMLDVKRKWLFWALGAASVMALISAMSLMSRTGFLAISLTVLTFLWLNMKSRKTLFVGLVLMGGLFMLTPDAIKSRLTLSTKNRQNMHRVEGRTQVYTSAVENFNEYWLFGVGEGNYFGGWGYQSGFRVGDMTLGAHNSFLQTLIFYGFLPFMLLILICFRSIRDFLKLRHGRYGFFFCACIPALLCLLFFSHVLFSKIFSLLFGIALAGVWLKNQGDLMSPQEIRT